jgi:hypothetical protein
MRRGGGGIVERTTTIIVIIIIIITIYYHHQEGARRRRHSGPNLPVLRMVLAFIFSLHITPSHTMLTTLRNTHMDIHIPHTLSPSCFLFYTHTDTRKLTNTCTYMKTCTCTHACMHTLTHTHAHNTRTCTYIHACTRTGLKRATLGTFAPPLKVHPYCVREKRCFKTRVVVSESNDYAPPL